MKSRRLLKFWRRLRECINEERATLLQFSDDLLDRRRLVPLRQFLKACTYGRRVGLLALLQVIQPFLPQLLHVCEVPDVLSDGPLSLKLPMGVSIIHVQDKRFQSRQRAAKSLNEVGEHPWRMDKAELSFRPWRTVEL
jgi:hypothetical protein